MGMFDYVTCEYPLPPAIINGKKVSFDKDELFQTKDLYCVLDRYTIKSNGFLFLKRNNTYKNLYYHGMLSFHTIKDFEEIDDLYFIYYTCKFTDGKIVDISVAIK